MNGRDQRRYDRATRFQIFGEENAADFANLDGLIDQTDEAKAGQTPNRVSKSTLHGGVENTELIGQLLDKINDEIGELDAIMYNKYTHQPEKLRAWQSASHIERAPQREKKPPTPAPPPPQ